MIFNNADCCSKREISLVVLHFSVSRMKSNVLLKARVVAESEENLSKPIRLRTLSGSIPT